MDQDVAEGRPIFAIGPEEPDFYNEDTTGRTAGQLYEFFDDSFGGEDWEFHRLPNPTCQDPISLDTLLQEQKHDPFCATLRATFDRPHSAFYVNGSGLLCRKSPLDGYKQQVVPATLRKGVLYLAHV